MSWESDWENTSSGARRLLEEAEQMEYGPERISLTELAVRQAEADGDQRLAYESRKELISAGVFGGNPQTAIVAFSWCLSHAEKVLGHVEYDLLWKLKWVVGNILEEPTVSARQIEELAEEMRQRHAAFGDRLQGYHQVMRGVCLAMGRLDEAKEHHKLARRGSRSFMSNCVACVLDAEAGFHAELGRHRMALKAAGPVLAGLHQCQEVPQRTVPTLLLSLFLLREDDRFRELQPANYRSIRRLPQFLRQHGEHIEALALSLNLDEAEKLLARHLPSAFRICGTLERFDFWRSVLLYARVAERAGRTSLRLRPPEAMRLPSTAGKVELSDLTRWLESEVDRLAIVFDRRNGNGYFCSKVQKIGTLARKARPVPLE